MKYTRAHLRGIFDSLSSKSEFQGHITIADFPLKDGADGPLRKQFIINLDEDSDGSVNAFDAASARTTTTREETDSEDGFLEIDKLNDSSGDVDKANKTDDGGAEEGSDEDTTQSERR